MATTIDRIAHDAAQLLKVVGAITSADGGPRALLATLGWDVPPGVTDIGLAQLDFSRVVQAVERVQEALSSNASEAVLAERFAELLVELDKAFTHLRAVVAGLSATGDYLDQTHIKSELVPRLTDLLAASRLASASPIAFLFLQLFGIVKLKPFQADAVIYQVEHVRTIVDWDSLPQLFSDPVGLLQSRYGWGTPTFDGESLITNLSALLEAIGEPVRARPLPRRVEEQLAGRFIPDADLAPATQLIASVARGDANSGLDAGMSVFPLRPSAVGASDGGLALNPFVHGFAQLQFPIAPNTTLEFESTAALDSGVVLQFRPGAAPSLKAGLLGSGGIVDGATGKAVVRLKLGAPAGRPHKLLELPGGGVIEFDSMTFAGGVDVLDGALAPSFGLKVAGGRAAIKPDGADSFIASILPDDGLDLHFDLGARWSAEHGFAFEGSASADIDLPIKLSIGGLEVSRLHVGVRPAASQLALEVSVAAAVKIGPVSAAVDRIGTLASVAFQDGNLGPLDLDLGFKPPSGVGLSVDARGVVTGGGFLFHDDVQGLYAGAMQLSLRDQITLKAFGLIATRMPDGSRGYSLIVFITAEDFRPIPLGLGFTLLGIGGMVGVNRTFDEKALREGLKNGTLATLLFPRDPVGNADTLIRNLATAFPARRDSYLLGLVAKIGWFTPTLILMDLALIFEFGSRERLLALGRISAALPSPDNDLIRLNMEAMGVLDFDAGTAAVDAVLVDSRLAHKFPITGSAALRAGFGDGPSFVLSVGGFNPHFAPPAGVPELRRVAIALSSGDNPRLLCNAYFAITSNTVQFGADASLYASAAGFSVEGNVGFDVLVQLAPLHFLAEFHAKLQLKRGAHNLFGVKLAGALEGPRPLRVSGKATFSILWCDFSVHFDTTLVRGERPPLPPAVNVFAQLAQALASSSSWSTQRNATQTHGVALRSLPPAGGTGSIVLDPLGQLTVRQQVVPLNTSRDIETFGGAPVAGDRRFALTASLAGTPLRSSPLQAPFAPAQFFVMSDDEKLAAPSSQPMDAGCVFGDEVTSFDGTQIIPAPIEYQIISITLQGSTSTAPPGAAPAPYTMGVAQLQTFTRSGAAARAPVRRVGRARFRNDAVESGARFNDPRWAILPTGDGPPATVGVAVRSYSEYQAALKDLNRAGVRWQIVPAYELET
ncbi:MAG TPA: DUF6603 domain-containing protein [Vicinamibacterales bacterium]|nr:DUF6603 domain-containing protein [Vicinamibacterales bacterium]